MPQSRIIGNLKNLILPLIDLYQFVGRSFLPPACRFSPSCSDYAKQAVEAAGWRGLLAAGKRLLRCHPFHSGGWEPYG